MLLCCRTLTLLAALTIALPTAAFSADVQKAEMAGYLLVSSDKVPDAYNAGFSLYAAAYAGGMLDVWEGQVKVVNTVPHTGLAVSNDIYDGTTNGGFKERPDKVTGWLLVVVGNPHPSRKRRVAARLADIALVKTYGQPDRVVFGPMYDSHEIKGDRVLVKFKHAGSGLTTRDGKSPDWFEISDKPYAYITAATSSLTTLPGSPKILAAY